MTDEEALSSYERRPRYQPGQRVEIIMPGVWQGKQAEIRSVRAWSRVDGKVLTYGYTLQFDNLVRQEWTEEHLRLVTSANGEGSQP